MGARVSALSDGPGSTVPSPSGSLQHTGRLSLRHTLLLGCKSPVGLPWDLRSAFLKSPCALPTTHTRHKKGSQHVCLESDRVCRGHSGQLGFLRLSATLAIGPITPGPCGLGSAAHLPTGQVSGGSQVLVCRDTGLLSQAETMRTMKHRLSPPDSHCASSTPREGRAVGPPREGLWPSPVL